MSSVPVLIVGYFFGAMSLAWTYAWLVVPVLVIAWLLLFVPNETWSSMRTSIAGLFGGSNAEPATARVSLDKRVAYSR
ncbi:hypothetical protein JGU71_16545 [Antrihabitans sp. YC3-6]|jgi:hypothetical protein|uniref:Uncharacterized protein n=1 Tax=Antrihabitans stalagmiti TaxID=2799499 RepID=A0A934U4J7_9NOCA|nr:hypothetical protein [Antrihabitans stalagmiti]MBJ8340501.1 hypothetical protein [Antrihabitans stalagmiti]